MSDNNDIRYISKDDPGFPECIRILPDCPEGLYVRGNLPESGVPSVSMVGSRACSGYGREYAIKYASRLALSGIQIISGMAVGIDSICARAAIESGGRTFAVLGSGIDVIYPRENIELYYNIITGGGGIISEYPPGTPPNPWQFPHRNRLISALGDKLIVIEAGKRSGTLSTAMHALDQGKDIWALPGRANDRLSSGCNELISDGAGILTDIDRVIDELTVRAEASGSVSPIKGAGSCEREDSDSLPDSKRLIYGLIGYEPVAIKDICDKSRLPAGTVLEILAELEIDDLIGNVQGAFYIRKR